MTNFKNKENGGRKLIELLRAGTNKNNVEIATLAFALGLEAGASVQPQKTA